MIQKITLWSIAALASLGVFYLYTRADFLLMLASQMWGCF
jgi:hypothetical protein